MVMHEQVMCLKKFIMGKNTIQTTTITFDNQSHNLECKKT